MFRTRRFARFSSSLLVGLGYLVVSASPAHATITTLKLAVFQGDLTDWINAEGGGTTGVNAVAANLSQADVLVVTNAFLHTYGGAEWPNQRGCQDLVDDHQALTNVLARLATIKPSEQIFGYVAGPADAPDQIIGGVSQPALCGNTVNNFLPGSTVLQPDGVTYSKATTFSACPAGTCSNFILWANQWANSADPLHNYIDGIFIDYVNAEKMSTSVRDNEYSYVHALGLKVMANSTLPGDPCDACTGPDLNGDYGTTPNYSFAADSGYLNSNDYIMVEGYWYAGFNGNGGVATDESGPTSQIASIRSSLAAKYGGVEPRIAALVTEPTDAAFTSLSCSWSDFTTAKSEFLASAVTNDAIAYQFSDYGILEDANGAPKLPIPYCG